MDDLHSDTRSIRGITGRLLRPLRVVEESGTSDHTDEQGKESQGVSRRRFVQGAVVGTVGAAGAFVATRFLPPLPGVSQMIPAMGTAHAICDQTCSWNNGCSYLDDTFCICATRCNDYHDPDCAECNDADYVEDWVLVRRWKDHPTPGACQCWHGTTCGGGNGHYFRWTCSGCC